MITFGFCCYCGDNIIIDIRPDRMLLYIIMGLGTYFCQEKARTPSIQAINSHPPVLIMPKRTTMNMLVGIGPDVHTQDLFAERRK